MNLFKIDLSYLQCRHNGRWNNVIGFDLSKDELYIEGKEGNETLKLSEAHIEVMEEGLNLNGWERTINNEPIKKGRTTRRPKLKAAREGI